MARMAVNIHRVLVFLGDFSETLPETEERSEGGKVTRTCEKCQHLFPSTAKLKIHLLTHTKEKLHKCEICGKRLIRRVHRRHRLGLVQSETKNTDEKHFTCEICCGRFFSKEMLNKHMQLVHVQEKLLSCELCSERFANNDALKAHAANHGKKRPDSFTCSICKKDFQTISNLAIHLGAHASAIQCVDNATPMADIDDTAEGTTCPRCNVCSKTFLNLDYLASHLLTHSVEKPSVCRICRVGFLHSILLEHHVCPSPVEKPYSCTVCHEKFSNVDSLEVHFYTHSKEKFFFCSICDKGFMTKKYLQDHRHNQHPTFACNFCYRCYATKNELVRHKCSSRQDD